MIGIVLLVENYSDSDEPLWELHVDTAINRSCDGVSIWEPWTVYVDTSAEASEEADSFGLRRPTEST